MNRGRAELGALVGACRAAGVTDLLVLHETRGRPGQCCHARGADPGVPHTLALGVPLPTFPPDLGVSLPPPEFVGSLSSIWGVPMPTLTPHPSLGDVLGVSPQRAWG